MCGQAGIILGRKRRSKDERRELLKLFAQLLILNQSRGHHATGLAFVNSDGKHSLYKADVPARDFIHDSMFLDMISLENFTSKTTLIAGHTRWATVGSPQNPRNNHPILAGSVLGTHNGTITNADQVANAFQIPRKAEVDSEVIFRIATKLCLNAGRIDMAKLVDKLGYLRGEMASVMVSKQDPETVIVLKGTKPLALRYCKKARAVLYSSESIHIDAVVAGSTMRWRKIKVDKNRYLRFDHQRLHKYFIGNFSIQENVSSSKGYFTKKKYSTGRTRKALASSGSAYWNEDAWVDSDIYESFTDPKNLSVKHYRPNKKKKRK